MDLSKYETTRNGRGYLIPKDDQGNWDDALNQTIIHMNDDVDAISASLDKKVSYAAKKAYPPEGINDFNLLPQGYCRVNEEFGEMEHSPIPGYCNGEVFTNNDEMGFVTQTVVTAAGEKFQRVGSPKKNEFSEWREIVLKDSLSCYHLLLKNGFISEGNSYYWRNACGEVGISFKVKRQGNLDESGFMEMGVLPIGFRPLTYTVHGVAYGHSPIQMIPFFIKESGSIFICFATGLEYVMGSISFAAR